MADIGGGYHHNRLFAARGDDSEFFNSGFAGFNTGDNQCAFKAGSGNTDIADKYFDPGFIYLCDQCLIDTFCCEDNQWFYGRGILVGHAIQYCIISCQLYIA